MNFEWFKLKAESNLKKHGVSFNEAATVFDDEMQVTYPDHAHSSGEQRFLCLGCSNQGRILMIVYTEPAEDTIRIISAREATEREKRTYGTQNNYP
jgi:uncharacterized protein